MPDKKPSNTPVVTSGNGQVDNVGLDQLLASAADSHGRRFIPGTELAKAAAGLARRPHKVAGRTTSTVTELAKIAAGRSEIRPPRDPRFKDPAWQESWLFRRIGQGYVSLSDYARDLLDESKLSWEEEQRLKVAVDNLIDGLAPTNFPLTNPTVLKTTIERGGRNFVDGARAAVRDVRSPVKLPQSVDPEPFAVGETLAVSEGAVVRREERYELLQYNATESEVHEIPVVLIPPMISKFYVVDLAPKKSTVQFLSKHGLQVFAVSWRNAGEEHAHWDFDAYISSIVEAVETTRQIANSDQVHVVGYCAGGVAVTAAMAYLAAVGKMDQIASLNLMVTVLDMAKGGPVMSFVSRDAAKAAKRKVARKGYLPGTELARVFAWLRPNEMVWNNFVNNYYLGNRPPALDLLYWNLDSMNLPAGLHRTMIDMGLDNPLVRPGAMTVLGEPIDLSQITCDALVVGGETDHLTPWQSCWKSTRLLGGTTDFVLSTSGHIAAVIHPPGNPKSAYYMGPRDAATPEQWLDAAERHDGTWWGVWAPWLVERAGELKPAPKKLGRGRHQPLVPAPGTYVFERSTG